MAKKNDVKKEEKKDAKEFKEFSVKGLAARVYPANETGKVKRSFMYLNFGNGFSIQCHFIETSDNYFIAFPQYKSGESYRSYVWVEPESKMQENLDALADAIYSSSN